jgi:hypothetical protein
MLHSFFSSFNKKASANMWWIIIGAVIALVVMIVLMVMFTQKTAGLETGISACEGKGGLCISGQTPPNGMVYSGIFECSEGGKCYIGSPKKCNDGTCSDGNQCGSYIKGAQTLRYCYSTN